MSTIDTSETAGIPNRFDYIYTYQSTTNQLPTGYTARFLTQEGDPVRFVIVGAGLTYSGGTVTGGTVTSFRATDEDGNLIFRVAGFSADAAEFDAAIRNDNTFSPDGRYQFLVSLLDDNTTGTGSVGDDGFEVGAGDDRVRGFAGDDMVFKWKAGDLDFDGGGGSDTVLFQAATGIINPLTDRQLIVNLAAGTGVNPFGGGVLDLKGVENVIGTGSADRLTGSNAANRFGDGIFDEGADTINGLGGNDWVELAEGEFGNPGGIRANGGTGTDTLAVNTGVWGSSGPTSHKLDLTNQANNTGVFLNDVLTNFEVFVPGSGFFAFNGHRFRFIDTSEAHSVTAMGQTSTLDMGGGDDTVTLLTVNTAAIPYRVVANAGAGTDTLHFEIHFTSTSNNVLDLQDPANNTGIFKNSTFRGFEVFEHTDLDGVGRRFTFRGSGNAETVTSALGIDDLDGRGGDTLAGGLGADRFAGGAGRDVFQFDSLADSGLKGKTLDLITDFAAGGPKTFVDRLDFSSIDADETRAGNQAFTFIGASAFSANSPGEVRFQHQGGNTLVSLNADNDAAAEMRIKLAGLVTLGASDILG